MDTMHQTIRLICFDIGGVLFRIHSDFTHCFKAVSLPVHTILSNKKEALDHLLQRYQEGRLDIIEYCNTFSTICRQTYTPMQVLTAHHGQLITQHTPEETADLFYTLKCAGYKTALLSNTCSAHWKTLQHHQGFMQTDYQFLSFEIGQAKPKQEIYTHVEVTADCAAENILFFDDSPKNIAAAKRRGWFTHQILGGAPPIEQVKIILRRYEMLA